MSQFSKFVSNLTLRRFLQHMGLNGPLPEMIETIDEDLKNFYGDYGIKGSITNATLEQLQRLLEDEEAAASLDISSQTGRGTR